MMRLWLLGVCLFMAFACSDPSSRIRGEFMSGCMQGGAPEEVCECSYARLSPKHSEEELEAVARGNRTVPESLLDDVIESALACSSEH